MEAGPSVPRLTDGVGHSLAGLMVPPPSDGRKRHNSGLLGVGAGSSLGLSLSMAFDLKRVLKVMLFASNGSLSVKDIQTAITRFHEQATVLPLEESAEGSAEQGASPEAPAAEAAP